MCLILFVRDIYMCVCFKLLSLIALTSTPFTGTGQNCYAQMFFKVMGSTLSGIGINVDAVAIHPIPKKRLRVKLERQMFGIEYLVWNSLGDARYIRRPTFSSPLPSSSISSSSEKIKK